MEAVGVMAGPSQVDFRGVLEEGEESVSSSIHALLSVQAVHGMA